MKIVPLTDVSVGPRQRSNIATGPLNDLKESILGRGLLNPPVFWFNPETQKWELVAGERRLRALTEIINDKKVYHCGDSIIPSGHIAITPLGDYLDAVGRFEAELDENVQRVDLEWPDRMRAYAALHAMRLKSNPKHTIAATAGEIALKADYSATSKHMNAVVQQAIVLEQHLHNPKIANARNAAEALGLVYKQEEERVLAALIKRSIAAAPKGAAIEIRHADLFDLLPKLDSGQFDLVIADPPYGIEASGAGFRARSVHHHNYKDDLESAKAMAQTILTEGFRLTKQRANIFIFCDIDVFPWLKLTASNMGWTVFRRPLIWMKSESEGLAPWGGQGPRITTEFIFYATKGQRGLNASPVDILDYRRVGRDDRIHAGQKPTELLKTLINCSTLPGDRVLDPCCGSGSTLVAAKELHRQGLGIESDPDYYNTALSNVFGSTVKAAAGS